MYEPATVLKHKSILLMLINVNGMLKWARELVAHMHLYLKQRTHAHYYCSLLHMLGQIVVVHLHIRGLSYCHNDEDYSDSRLR